MVGSNMLPAKTVDRRYWEQGVLTDALRDLVSRGIRVSDHRDFLPATSEYCAVIFAELIQCVLKRARLSRARARVQEEALWADGVQAVSDLCIGAIIEVCRRGLNFRHRLAPS